MHERERGIKTGDRERGKRHFVGIQVLLMTQNVRGACYIHAPHEQK